MGRWRDSRGWRFCPKAFDRNDLHDLKIIATETLASSLRPAFHRPHFAQEVPESDQASDPNP